MLCAQPVTRLAEDEIKPSIQTILRIMCSSFMGNLNEHISMCEEHVSMEHPTEGTAWFQVPKRAMSDAIYAEQELRYVLDMDKPESMLGDQLGTRLKPDARYPLGFRISRFQVLKRAMSDALHTGQELRYVVKQVTGDTDKPLSMLRKQLGIRLMKDEVKPDTRYPLGLMVSRFQVLKRTMSDALHTGQELRFVAKEVVGDDTKAAQGQQRKLEPIFNATAKDEKFPDINTLASKYNSEPKKIDEKANVAAKDAIKYNLKPKKIYEKASFQSAAAKDEKFPNIDILAIKYNLESKRIYEKASFQSAAAKDEKVPNIDILAIKYNLEPKRTYEKASFQSAATKDEKLPNIDTLAGKHNPEPKKTGDQYEQTGTQSPRNWSILTGWWTVPRSLVNGRTARDQRKRVEPMLESWDEMNAKALTR